MMTTTITITPDLPYFAAVAVGDWDVARLVAREADLGADHLEAIDRAERIAAAECAEEDDLVLCASGDGYSLHAPGSTDDDIASGGAPYLWSGEEHPGPVERRAALREMIRRAYA